MEVGQEFVLPSGHTLVTLNIWPAGPDDMDPEKAVMETMPRVVCRYIRAPGCINRYVTLRKDWFDKYAKPHHGQTS